MYLKRLHWGNLNMSRAVGCLFIVIGLLNAVPIELYAFGYIPDLDFPRGCICALLAFFGMFIGGMLVTV